MTPRKKPKSFERWAIIHPAGAIFHLQYGVPDWSRRDFVLDFVHNYEPAFLPEDRTWKTWYKQGYRCKRVRLEVL